MKKLLLLLIIITPILTFAQEIGQWRTTKDFTVGDRVSSYPDAYALHACGNLYITKKFEDFGVRWWKADLITLSLGVLWEVKDGYIPVEQVPILGGDGFSSTDIAINSVIIVGNRIIRFGFKKFMPKYLNNFSIQFNYLPNKY